MDTPKSRAARFSSGEGTGSIVSHTIRFRRPETPYSLSKMTASSEQETMAQIQRLKSLGYAIVEVIPPLAGDAPVAP
jgi:hypothetical protein